MRQWMLVVLIVLGIARAGFAEPDVPSHLGAPITWNETLSPLSIPGPPRFATQVLEVMDVLFTIDPSMASGAGLFADARRVPTYDAEAVRAMSARLTRAKAAMRAMPWRTWDVDTQIDFRWVYAWAELAQRQLDVERMYTHRPGQWLEPTANNLIALVTYAPERLELQANVLRRVPAMVDEMRRVCVAPTVRDVEVTKGLLKGLLAMCEAPVDMKAQQARALLEARAAAATSLRAYLADLKPTGADAEMIGRDNFAWRMKHFMLLPWTPESLLALAESEKARVEGEIAGLKSAVSSAPSAPTPEMERMARELTRDRLLGLYDAIVAADRAEIVRTGLMTIPSGVGPIRARETPDAMVPLTGDGGSMNPPPTFVQSNVGYWNVEHFDPAMSYDERLQAVRGALEFRVNGMGPYAVHEGVPGHHLQLAIARLNPDPLRSILPDPVQNEGWALYAEEAFWRAGGLGPSDAARLNTLRSYLARVKRVVYDVNVESGKWTLQQAADWKYGAGKGRVDPDIMRSVNWPTQLVCYFSGKMEILRLREDYRRKLGAAYTERKFHDALLAVGSVPIVFARCKLLGEPVPDL